jgi:hypothetical protein
MISWKMATLIRVNSKALDNPSKCQYMSLFVSAEGSWRVHAWGYDGLGRVTD